MTRALLQELPSAFRSVPILVTARQFLPEDICDLFEAGVSDFVTPPLKPANVIPRVLRWRRQNEAGPLGGAFQVLREEFGLKEIIGKSRKFVLEVEKLPRIAKFDVTALVLGESGTGKDLVARAIHYLSPRAHHSFAPVNCGAIPVDLVENELFGHERGAYTGASASHRGLIAEADGGTLFLDEVDALPLQAQTKLLRFIQEKEYRPLGGKKTLRADVRIIAATNTDIEKVVGEGRFRADLYYRLNVISIQLPALRDRKEDIPLLAEFFLQKYSFELNQIVAGFSPPAARKLLNYRWPGNIRELENVIERAVILATQSIIQPVDLTLPEGRGDDGEEESFREAKARAIARFERDFLVQGLIASRGNISRAARASGKNRRAYWELIRKHQIDASEFRLSQEPASRPI